MSAPRSVTASIKAPSARVNYDIERDCPGETTCTGIPGRFGICLENGDFEKALALLRESGIELAGCTCTRAAKREVSRSTAASPGRRCR